MDWSSLPPAMRAFLGFRLAWVAARSGEYYARALAATGLDAHQLGVLSILAAEGALTQARLSERIQVFKPVMVTIINALEAHQLVERRPHPTDRRAFLIHLLPAGEQRLRDAERVSAHANAEFFAPLSAREREQLEALLAKLTHRPGDADA